MQGDGPDESARPAQNDSSPGDLRGAGDDLVAQFARWSAGQRSSEAARSRSREKSLRDQAFAGATWAGALVDLAERCSPVTICVGSARMSGTMEAVGPDFCVLVRPGGRAVLARLDRVSSVWPDAAGGPGAPGTGRFPPLELSLAAALSSLAEDRWPVNLALAGGQQIAGDLVAVGEDVLTVRERDGARRSALVPLEAVDYCELR